MPCVFCERDGTDGLDANERKKLAQLFVKEARKGAIKTRGFDKKRDGWCKGSVCLNPINYNKEEESLRSLVANCPNILQYLEDHEESRLFAPELETAQRLFKVTGVKA